MRAMRMPALAPWKSRSRERDCRSYRVCGSPGGCAGPALRAVCCGSAAPRRSARGHTCSALRRRGDHRLSFRSHETSQFWLALTICGGGPPRRPRRVENRAKARDSEIIAACARRGCTAHDARTCHMRRESGTRLAVARPAQRLLDPPDAYDSAADPLQSIEWDSVTGGDVLPSHDRDSVEATGRV